MNYLLCSVGRRGELLKNIRQTLGPDSVLVATDNSPYAPALYMADRKYLVPKITEPGYVNKLLEICEAEKISAITTFIDPEIELLATHRAEFEAIGVEVLAPYESTARLCFDKYQMFCFLKEHGISTVQTWETLENFTLDYRSGHISFPVFVKPRTGSGSVGARKVLTYETLEPLMRAEPDLIIQEFMDAQDLDADVYIDTISHRAVSAFCKKKIEMRIGGASKTVSFKDPVLFELIRKIVSVMKFNGPVDMDFFYRDGSYYLSEINPRFGGAYLHAYGAGVDFIRMIEKNLRGIENEPSFGAYEEGVVMMMYDSVVIRQADELATEEK